MLLAILFAVSLDQTPAARTPADVCSPLSPDAGVALLCLGDTERRAAESLRPGTEQRRRRLETAATHYRKAAATGRHEVLVQALTGLAALYDSALLNDPAQREGVLRAHIAADPLNVGVVFQLADLQQAAGAVDAAEQTLLDARHRLPENIDVYRRLAQFYARRVTNLQGIKRAESPKEPDHPGEPDVNGVYRVGGQLSPPARLDDNPEYPVEAQSAGIEGEVLAEVVVGADGRVTDAKIVESVPLLDEPALAAVRRWNFKPTMVDGKPVPVRMMVTVRFTLSR